MKKKRLRYSDLAPEKPAPQAVDVVTAAVEVAAAVGVAPEHVVRPARPRRDSTPIELARAIAREGAPGITATPLPAPSRATPVLLFRLGTERFAVDLLDVEEVIDRPEIHHVPEMPPAMLGVVTVRGSLTPVYSPEQVLGIPLAQREAVLIFRQAQRSVGILIDDVDDTVAMDVRALREAYRAAGRDDAVAGVMRHDGALVAIIEAKALIAACRSAAVLVTA